MNPQTGPLKRMLGAVCALVQTRLELISIEVAEEKSRVFILVCIGLAAMLFSLLSLMTFTVLIAAIFWESYRWQALTVLTLTYFIAAALCVLRARARLREAPPLFAATRAELAKDYEALTETD